MESLSHPRKLTLLLIIEYATSIQNSPFVPKMSFIAFFLTPESNEGLHVALGCRSPGLL